MNVRLVGLAGPSGSGKSTLARRLLAEHPHGVEVIKLDKFFKDASEFPRVGPWSNWELPENINFGGLYEALIALKDGQPARVPNYSKPEGRQLGARIAQPASIILVEGFLLFYEQRLRDLFELKVYLDIPLSAQLERRLAREPNFDRDYFEQVMVQAFAHYGAEAAEHADAVLNAGSDPEVLWRQFRSLIVAE